VATGDSSSWTNGNVYGNTQDILQWQLATLIAGQLVQCMEYTSYITETTGDSSSWTFGPVYGDTQDISQWQLATLIAGQIVQCMEMYKLYHSGNWRLQ
jgi:hypothetical protein